MQSDSTVPTWKVFVVLVGLSNMLCKGEVRQLSTGEEKAVPAPPLDSPQPNLDEPPAATQRTSPPCGSRRCSSDQICVHPTCCQGSGAPCHPLPQDGKCPPNTFPYVCSGTQRPGCQERPCDDPPPYCVKLPPSCVTSPTCDCANKNKLCMPGECMRFSAAARELKCGCP